FHWLLADPRRLSDSIALQARTVPHSVSLGPLSRTVSPRPGSRHCALAISPGSDFRLPSAGRQLAPPVRVELAAGRRVDRGSGPGAARWRRPAGCLLATPVRRLSRSGGPERIVPPSWVRLPETVVVS